MENINRKVFLSQLEATLENTFGANSSEWGLFPAPSMNYGTWMRDGTLFLYEEEGTQLCIRVPLVGGITVTPTILKWIEGANRNTLAGHVWLREGSDENNWGLMWGMKFPWDWMDQSNIDTILQVSIGVGKAMNSMLGNYFIENYGGMPYWDTDGENITMTTQAMIFMD